jgi:dihydroorotate dehydrogenase (fumarate)
VANDYELAGQHLDAPLVNAAGAINGTSAEGVLREVSMLAATGIGGITVGSFTIPSQEGNEAKFGTPVYYHNKATGRTYNSMGLPNIGKDAAVELAPEVVTRAHDKGKITIFSGSPTNAAEHGTSVDQAVRLVYDFLETDADLVELNVSCPNVVTEGGGRKPIMGYDLESMLELVDGLAEEVGEGQRIGVKLPPYLSKTEQLLVPEVAKILRTKNVFRFLVTSNTIPNQIALDSSGIPVLTVPKGKGGMSGPATKEVGRQQLDLWREQLPDTEIVSTLGVDNGKELAVRLQMGAVAAGGVTFLWESRDWKQAVTNVLSDFAETEN